MSEGANRVMLDMTPGVVFVIRGIRDRIRTLKTQGLTPWRIELGSELAEEIGNPRELLGLPVETVPLKDYFRVAYLEWAQERAGR